MPLWRVLTLALVVSSLAANAPAAASSDCTVGQADTDVDTGAAGVSPLRFYVVGTSIWQETNGYDGLQNGDEHSPPGCVVIEADALVF